MARVTVEDCLDKVESRFELVRMATRRARMLESGRSQAKLENNPNKHTLVALREIAEGLVDNEWLDEQEHSADLDGEP